MCIPPPLSFRVGPRRRSVLRFSTARSSATQRLAVGYPPPALSPRVVSTHTHRAARAWRVRGSSPARMW